MRVSPIVFTAMAAVAMIPAVASKDRCCAQERRPERHLQATGGIIIAGDCNPCTERCRGYVCSTRDCEGQDCYILTSPFETACANRGGTFCPMKPECRGPACGGDPHFKTWSGEWYDYHGECDSVLLSTPAFGKGLGLTIHTRLTGRYEYSYIESAAIQVGDDVLEVSSYGSYMFNGISNAKMPAMFADLYSVSYYAKSDKEHIFDIQITPEEHILVSAFKDLVSVKLQNVTTASFASSTGLMGRYGDGAKVGRDGTTLFEENNDFGQEWQVRLTEPKLFQVKRAPQYPEKCVLPDGTQKASRRLGEASIAQEAAEKACAHWGETKELCVYDVMAVGDLEIAQAGAF